MAEITKKEFLELLQEFSEKNLNPKFQKIDTRFEKIDERFEKIDARFEKIDGRFEKVDLQFVEFKKEIVHEFRLIFEDITSKARLLAEGLIDLDKKFDRRMDGFEKKNEEQHKNILAALRFPVRTS